MDIISPVGGIDTSGYATTATGSKAAQSDFFEVLSQARESSPQNTLDDIFERAAARYNVSADLLKAIGKAESGFNAGAVSCAGACGVMQLMPSTAKSLGVTDPFDPEQNIMGGAKLISQLLDTYNGDVKLALAAYNAGSGNVSKYGGVPPFAETQNYIEKVIAYMDGGDLSASGAVYGRSSAGSGYLQGSYQSSDGQPKSELDLFIYSRFFELMTKNDDEGDRKVI